LPVRSHESFRRIQVHRYINSFLDRDSHLTWTSYMPRSQSHAGTEGIYDGHLIPGFLTTLSELQRLHSYEWWDDAWVMNWKGCGRTRLWHIWWHYSGICRAGLRKTTKHSARIRASERRFEPGTSRIRSRC
jgi:hypothetical protein